jgi:ABC-2 type transport system permease protein
MFALLHKEISSFFSSLTGYVVMLVFLTANSLFMWVFRGELNVLDTGYASMDALFRLAPWIFLFLVPAITMRLFAEEKRSGTMELLMTLPVPGFQIILAKYLASVLLILFSLLPTLVFYISIYTMGSPPGNLDSGGIWGSYLGLIFLGGVYASVGIFISSLTDNQIISFITTVLICFFLYTGFDLITSLDLFGNLSYFILNLGINEHYISISRGVLDTRDLIYFLSLIVFFLFVTNAVLAGWNAGKLKQFGITLLAILLINVLSSRLFHRWDMTSEKRYSISAATKDVLGDLEEMAYIRVYLDGDLPVGFTRLRSAIREMLDEFKIYSGGNIHYEFIDPTENPDQGQQQELFRDLVEAGLQPTNAQVVQKDGSKIQKILFPGAIISHNGFEAPVNLLKNSMGQAGETNLQNSIQSLEYEFIIMLRNLSSDTIEKVAFLEGHREFDEYHVGHIMRSLSSFYQVDRGPVMGRAGIMDGYKAVIIAGPTEAFSEEDKFVIDQYIMNGGKVLWLLDPVRVSMDSIQMGSTVAFYSPINLDDQLFRYGVRLNPDLVQDMQCHFIPVNKSLVGTNPSWQFSPWYYYPVVSPGNNHIITRSLNMIWFRFASTIDTVGADPEIRKTILLRTSPNTRVMPVPAEISLRETDIQPQESSFNKPGQPLAVLLEGNFKSVFTNRPVPDDVQSTSEIRVIERSKETRMIVISDADIIANEVLDSPNGLVPAPLGYDSYTNQTFGNSELIVNCVNYLVRERGLMDIRNREFRIRLLDRKQILERSTYWKWFNTTVPVAIVVLFGLAMWIIRAGKFKKSYFS